MKARCTDLVDVIVWGNIDKRFYMDFSRSRIYRRRGKTDSVVGPSWFNLEAPPLLWNTEWLQKELVPTAVTKMKSPATYRAAACHASAMFEFLLQWHFGIVDREQTISSMVLISESK